MRHKYLCDREMFDIAANGMYSGVFVPTHVMKKFMRISAKWSTEIRQLFNEYKDELLLSNWTGYFPTDDNGKVTGSVIVRYYDPDGYTGEIKDRISLFVPKQPKHEDIYICDRETAVNIAKEIYEEEAELKQLTDKLQEGIDKDHVHNCDNS